MFARKSLSGIVVAAIAGSTLALTTSPAQAAEADDPSFTPVAADLIGVGSDTTMHAMHLLAEDPAGWNSRTPAPAARIASFAATGGGTIALPSGAVARPNGSGSGKALLYGAGNNPDVDFARSSSANSTTETQAGLQMFPFALDTLQMAVSNSVPSNAPASLTPQQIVGIYKGDITNWSQVGGTAGVIAPKTPQPGSGTRSFWDGKLKEMNNGVAVQYGSNVVEVQEHDDSQIKSNANAIAPFSVGRAELLGTTLRLAGGWKADRAVYNVVRAADLGNADVQAVFGENGFVCSTAARPLIEAAGFRQLATPAHGGVCGAATQSPASDFTLNEQVVTTTSLTGTSTSARAARLVARVTGSTAPDGTVAFYEGETLLAENVPLVSGQATHTVTGASPERHTYRAVFTPSAGTAFDPSEATRSVLVKTSSRLAESFPTSVAAGKRAVGTITVTLVGVASKATGTVVVKRGTQKVGSGTLSGGKVAITLAALPKGLNKLKAVWKGNAVAVGSTKAFSITQN